jgi:hypothetical protein
LRGRDVRAWVPSWDGLYLINTHNGIKAKDVPPINVAEEYPAIYAWLESYQPKISNRFDQGDHWSNLRNLAYLEEFDKPKIIYPEITNSLPFVFDRYDGFATNNKCFIVTGNHLSYLTSIFNSPLFRFFFKDNFPELLGNSFETRSVFFEKIPIKKPDPTTEWVFERLADYIIRAKRSKEHKMAGLFFQQLVNGLVYELYFGSAFEKAGIQLLTLLNDDNLPELPEGEVGLKNLVQVFEHLHDKQHSIRIGLFKLDTVREVRIIEGKEK